MALRTSSTPRAEPRPPTRAQWRDRVEAGCAEADAALQAGSLERLAAVFERAAGWPDRDRAHQLRRRVVDRVLAHRPQAAEAWIGAFSTTARMLLGSLEAEPAEPVILNLTGVLLHELREARAAELLFAAALRLDPELAHTRSNLDAARQMRQAGASRLGGRHGAELGMLRARAERTARLARPGRGLTLSLCMIVKDEEQMLPGCLEPLVGHVDEMIVVDTGSTDRTVEIAESFGATVVHRPWTGSFSDARNASIEAASGDWLMYLDADEHLEPEDAPRLRDLLGRTWREGFHLVETNYTGAAGAGSAVTHMALRVWRNRPQYRFEGRIHEQKTQTMPTFLPERFEATTIRVRHYGYLNQRIASREKSRRNIDLLLRESEEAPTPFTDYNLGSEYLAMGDWRRARTHFDRSWDDLRSSGSLTTVGYAPLLAARVARARRESGDHDAAAAAVRDGLALYPEHTDLVMEEALSARACGDRERAEALARRCLEMGDAPAHYAATVGTGSFLALALLAELARAGGDPDESERLLRRSLEQHPDYPLPVLPLVAALIARKAGPGDIAAVVIDHPTAHLLAGTALAEAGLDGEAEPWFRRALAAQPENGAARVGLADALLAQRRFGEAAQVASGQTPGTPAEPAALRVRLFVHALAGDAAALDGLLAQAGEAVAASDRPLYGAWADALAGRTPPAALPANVAAPALQTLEALLRVREFGAFETLVHRYRTIAQDVREQRDRLARVYLRQGYLESAADEWIAQAGEAPDARCMLGLAQVALARGLSEDAAAFAAEAVRLEPASSAAAEALAAIASQRSRAA